MGSYGKHHFDRLYTAVITPYQKDTFIIDETALRSLLQYFMQPRFSEAGGGIVINPEAGEVMYLSREEKRRNVEIAMEECGGKVPVFVGIGAVTTEEAIRSAEDAKQLGADGLFLMPPIGMADMTTSWNAEKYPEYWIDMVKDIVKEVDLPTIAHPVASITPTYGLGLPAEATKKMLDEVPNFVGWKMTYRYDGYKIIARLLRARNRHISILPSTAKNFHEVLSTGQMDGALTGSFNYAMEAMMDHIEAWRNLDVERAREIWNQGLAQLHEYVYSDYSRLHIRYKIATWLRGLIPHPFMRPPQPKPKREELTVLRDLLSKTGLSTLPEEEIQRVSEQCY